MLGFCAVKDAVSGQVVCCLNLQRIVLKMLFVADDWPQSFKG